MHPMPNRLAVAVMVVVGLLGSAAPVVAHQRASLAVPHMSWPTVGRITQPWGCTGFYLEPRRGSCRHFHIGIDIAHARGTPIRAAADGIVSYVGRDPWIRGRYRSWVVIIRHGNGVRTFYAHLKKRRVAGAGEGRRVKKGQLIGYMGNTGLSTGVHLHFGVIDDHRWVNPGRYVPDASPARH